jgi:hypothetical protein
MPVIKFPVVFSPNSSNPTGVKTSPRIVRVNRTFQNPPARAIELRNNVPNQAVVVNFPIAADRANFNPAVGAQIVIPAGQSTTLEIAENGVNDAANIRAIFMRSNLQGTVAGPIGDDGDIIVEC